jgi:hypothetical protein
MRKMRILSSRLVLDAKHTRRLIKWHGDEQVGCAPPDEDDLLQVSQEAGRLVIEALQAAAIVPAFYSQVAAAMVAADGPM